MKELYPMRTVCRYFLFCLAGLVSMMQLCAQQVSFAHFGITQGLSQNSVLAIAQDTRGFMWFGTQYGINRYDGFHFVTYKNIPGDTTSLSDNNVNTILCDAAQTLWVGTDKGLNKFDAERNCFTRISLLPNTVTYINCIYQDKKGVLWAGSSQGLFRRNADGNFALVNDAGLPSELVNKSIRSIYEDRGGDLWIGTTNGLVQLYYSNGHYSGNVFHADEKNAEALSSDFITAIAEDKDMNCWIATANGLNLYNKVTRTFTRFMSSPSGIVNNNIRAVLADASNKLWIGTQEGLTIMSLATKQCTSYRYNAADRKSLSQNSVHSIFEDKNGSVWVGTFFGGINVVHKYTTSFSILQHDNKVASLSNNVVSGIVADAKNNLWIGTEGGGLNYYDKASQKITAYTNQSATGSISSNLIKTVYIDRQQHLWVGTHGGGLNLFNPATGRFSYFLQATDKRPNYGEVVALLEDSNGLLWVGKHAGLNVFKWINNTLEPAPENTIAKQLSRNNVTSIIEDNKYNIWIATFTGLYRYERDKNKLSTIQVNTGDSNHNVNCIKEDAHGNIWIGLHYGGLGLYNADKNNFTFYTKEDGLPNDNVVSIQEDEQHFLWISTSNGLSKFNPSAKTFQNYTTSDGLAGNEFNYNSSFRDRNGELYFGGMEGLTSFFPAKIESNTTPAQLVFTGLKLFNRAVEINDKNNILQKDIGHTNTLTFNHNQNTFTIEFALLNFIKPNKNRFAYKLEGVNEEWTEVAVPAATFINLPAGHYTFLVKGSNNDGIWSKPVRMEIVVLPPFWKTWWAYCLYILVIAAVLFFIIRYFYMKALLDRDKELHRVKLNFFTNVSHEIRTHLTLIMTPVEKMEQDYKQNAVLSQQLGNIKNNAHRLLKLVSELMDFRKAETNHLQLHVEQHNLISFLSEIYKGFEELSLAKKISISFIHDADTLPLYFDEQQLEKVIFNLLTNAFKFTPEGGHILLHVENKQDRVLIHIIDNGRGIAPEFLDKLFTNFFQVYDHSKQNTGYGIGLALSKNIAELHKGSLTVKSTPPSATKEGQTSFTVSLLKGSVHFEAIEENDVTTEAQADNNATGFTTEIVPGDKQYTVLITEDNEELRNLVKEALEPHYNILEAGDGQEGLRIATEQIPDLVISDVMMPVMDGLVFCNHLKSDERTSHIPVILLTAKSAQSDHISGLEHGADVYITKPFSTQVLELHVKNLLSAREKIRRQFSGQLPLETSTSAPAPLANTVDAQFLSKLTQAIEENMENPGFGVDLLAVKVAMSQSVLYKKVKAVTGMSVNDFSKTVRLNKAAALLKQKQFTVYEVAYMIGFNDRKYFSKEFKKQFGVTPSEYADRET